MHGKTPAAVPAGIRLSPGGRNLYTLVFQTRPSRADHGSTDATCLVADLARESGYGAAVGVPVSAGGRLWGVMVVSSTQEEPAPPRQVRQAQAPQTARKRCHLSKPWTPLAGPTGPAGASSHSEQLRSGDEAPEWGASLLDSLCTPLEEGEVRLARADGTVRYPARFQLVRDGPTCPCASAHSRDWVCPSLVRCGYLGRLSGPPLDRVDLRARIFPVTTLGATGLRAGHPAEAAVTLRAASAWTMRRRRSARGDPRPTCRSLSSGRFRPALLGRTA